jgi:pantoate--beta-alanine ligase
LQLVIRIIVFMVVFKTVKDLQQYLAFNAERQSVKVGFVPTMGALHEGHISLVKRAKADGALVVVSVFVNPTQFNDKDDFEKYPTSIDADTGLLAEAGCDVLLLPTVSEIYPAGEQNMPVYDFGYLDTVLEGANRPGHFKGVGQVVARLLDVVQPQRLYMGQKDYQQCMVVTRLLHMLGKKETIEMVVCPTTREADGLAMSSRNRRLTQSQRALAGLLYQCLVSIQAKKDNTSFTIVEKECNDLLVAKGFEPDYIALADARDLTLLQNYDNSRPMVALIAAKIGDIRLIDNLLLN